LCGEAAQSNETCVIFALMLTISKFARLRQHEKRHFSFACAASPRKRTKETFSSALPEAKKPRITAETPRRLRKPDNQIGNIPLTLSR
jgi:hypothetical protein